VTNYSPDFTVKSNARRAARKTGIDPSKVVAVVKAGKTLYRYPLADVGKFKSNTDYIKSFNKPKTKTPAKSEKKTKIAKPAKAKKAAAKAKAPKDAAPKSDRGLKFIAVAALLRRAGGASITEVVAATGWKPHSARARISVDVSKLLDRGEEIQRRRENGVSHYAILKSKQLELPVTNKAEAA
jgi:hypothetical protein